MTVRSCRTQEMEEGFECLEEQNCDPPPRGPSPPVGSLSQRDKGNREEGLRESERKATSLGQVLEACVKASRSTQKLEWPGPTSGRKGPTGTKLIIHHFMFTSRREASFPSSPAHTALPQALSDSHASYCRPFFVVVASTIAVPCADIACSLYVSAGSVYQIGRAHV